MNILLRYFNAKVEIENIFEPTTENKSLYQNSNVNGVRILKFDTSKC